MSPQKHDKTLIVIPAYNEAVHIESLIKKIRQQGFNQVLIVDDASEDHTAAIARANGARVIRHIINRGPGAATQSGIEYARMHNYSRMLTIDADNQHDPEDIRVLLERLDRGDVDLVIGNRFMRGDNFIPRSRVIYNGIANLITFLFSRHWISDTQSGMKALNRKAIENTQLSTDGFEFCSEWVIKAGLMHLRIAEVPIKVYYTEESRKKGQGFLTGIRTLSSLFHQLLLRH